MPFYSYRCSSCESEFELLVRSDTVVACPKCGATQVSQLPSRVAEFGKMEAIRKSMRAQATKEGHTSYFDKS